MSRVKELVQYLQQQELPTENDYLSKSKKFTVLMSTYKNDETDFFEVALKSVIHNTVVPNEILIMVDGPVHRSMDHLLDRFKNHYPTVIKIFRQKNNIGRGLIAAKGVEFSSNELIARMDADDISELDRFEKQISILEQNEQVDIIGGQISEFNENLNLTTRRLVPTDHEEIVKFSRMRSPLNQPTVIFKKASVLSVGNYDNLTVLEDYDLWMRMIGDGMIFQNINTDLTYMRAPKNMYQRRGGVQYLRKYVTFRRSLLIRHLISNSDYVKSIIGMAVSAVIPTAFRKKIYSIFLRKDYE